uniref:NADH dehydrogenase [ubiquinone] 1 alpha subcomplex subunit 11 n=1 Tax=Cyprinus carpio carpio TaxID=630221 RepID=A0A9J8B314_CYPCA
MASPVLSVSSRCVDHAQCLSTCLLLFDPACTHIWILKCIATLPLLQYVYIHTYRLVGSAYHIVAYPPETAVEALTRATSGTASMAAMGAIFGMATCLSAQARDAPDDPTNYFIGGCASGIFLGARTHSAITGTTACIGLGTLAMFTKIGKMEGWRLTGPPKL